MIPVNIIVAIDAKQGIGKAGALPWHLSGDLKHFRDTTCTTRSPKKKNVVVMGRKTWESIPQGFRPLSERVNVVLTRNKGLAVPEDVLIAESFDKVLEMANSEQLRGIIETIFVIGGQQAYEEALKYSECQKLYITHIHATFDCDTVFPPFEESFESTQTSSPYSEESISYHFEEYQRKSI